MKNQVTQSRWTILQNLGTRNKRTVLLCQCECGTIKEVLQQSIRSGMSLSCGCLAAEARAAAITTHGMSHSPEYRIYWSMKERCLNPKNKRYADYGGRGITVCPEWQGKTGFENFFAHVGFKPSPAHSIDRIDNDGNYEPENVKWSTPAEQANNKRSNRMFTHDGKTMNLKDWAEFLGKPEVSIRLRLTRGWSLSDAILTPISKGGWAARRLGRTPS